MSGLDVATMSKVCSNYCFVCALQTTMLIHWRSIGYSRVQSCFWSSTHKHVQLRWPCIILLRHSHLTEQKLNIASFLAPSLESSS
ncbi:MAG: hypothetical protein IGNPGNKH_00296 [Sodalis sp. Ffu]|nr:MAG: hypothetical protein IGNPGNKH_00296 [Sodalis sp. Ffu]